MRNNIWVFGGTGFIGSHITQQLAQNPENRVILLVHKSLPSVHFENVITLQRELEDVSLADFKRFTPSQIFHLARFGATNPLFRLFSANKGAKANKRLLGEIEQLDKQPAINYVSGSLMYGAQQDIAYENAPLNPVGFARPYIDGESPFIEKQQSGLNIHFHRPGWILGPSSWFKIFFWDYYKKTNKIPYYGSGEQLMSIISVEDCASLIIHASNLLEHGKDQNIFIYEPISQMQFSQTIASALNTSIEQVSTNEVKRQYDWHTAEALTTSIPIGTLNDKIIKNYKPINPNLSEVIKDVLVELQKN
ncbi:MAG: NAD(P)-dependent oxidoreductase [Bacteroidia bacterium]